MSDLNDQLRDMFDSAEFQPSDRVWAGVEKAIAQKKKRVVFYMWQTYATAAAVLFIAAFSFLLGQRNGQGVTALNENSNSKQLTEVLKDSADAKPLATDTLIKPVLDSNVPLMAKQSDESTERSQNSGNAQLRALLNESAIPSASTFKLNSDQAFENDALGFNYAQLKAYRESLALKILIFNGMMNLSMYEPEEALLQDLNVDAEEKDFRVNGGLGSGTFNTGESSLFSLAAEEDASVNFSEARVDIATGEEKVESVISVGAGVNLGLSNKLSLDAGLRLSNFRISSTANAYSVENGLSLPISATAPFDPNELIFIGDYSTSNTFQSLFLQSALNYKVASFGRFDLNTRIGLGVDFFFNYKLQGDLNFLSVRKVNLGESDISSTSFSVIPGLGVNYHINDQFGVSIDASYRRFISDSSISINGGTSIFGLGFSLNYLIKKN